ncbi:MAG: ATP-binding protein [Lacunisphaera sp.]|nr:ATP-binding protein [Lacunisphaera sp.]
MNTQGVLEIQETVFEELLCNALLHRDYLIDAPIRLFLFDDRVEIISPGVLPGGLTVENIRQGASFIRNPLLTSFATKGLLPYRGIGTGILRVVHEFPQVELVNDVDALLFRVVVKRPAPVMARPTKIRAGVGERVGEKVGERVGDDSMLFRGDFTKTQLRILRAIAGNPQISAKTLSTKIGISSRKIEDHVRKLREHGVLVREGPDYGGSWKIVRD